MKYFCGDIVQAISTTSMSGLGLILICDELYIHTDWMPRRKVSKDDVERMVFLKDEGLTYSEIADELDYSYSTVAKYLKGKGKRTEITPELIDEMKGLRKDGLTYEEISEQLDVSYSTVAKYMKKEGLGRKRRKVNKDLIERMKDLEGAGVPRREIADRLDLSYSTVQKYLEKEEELGFFDRLKRKLGLE